KPALQMTRAAFQVIRHGDRRRAAYRARKLFALLAKVLEQNIAAERNSREKNRCSRSLIEHSIQRKFQIARFTGMVKTRRSVRLVAATAKDQQVRAPAASSRLVEETGHIVRANGPLQTVQEKKTRTVDWGVETVHV